VGSGHLAPGLQTGYCADTGGGWSTTGLVAHSSQLFAVPEGLSDADAVTTEPVACAVHAVLRSGISEGDLVAVLGAGTVGLTVTAALAHLVASGRCPAPRALLVGAKYGHQQRLARELGATQALPPDQLPRAVRRQSRSLSFGGAPGTTATLSGGADVVIDCVGSAESIAQSIAMVRPRGTVALVGMPGRVTLDLAPLWHREIRLAGAYAYGTETVPKVRAPRSSAARSASAPSATSAGSAGSAGARTGGARSSVAQVEEVSTFALAFEVVAALSTGRLVSATYPLTRFEEAVAHAGAAGRRGSVKIAFDITKGHTR
jgi:threonine dehydrogenase-like Zn-dependent dehydrogenase